MALTQRQKAQLRSLGKRGGDTLVKALLDSTNDLYLSAGLEISNAMLVNGKVVDGVGNPIQGVFNLTFEVLNSGADATVTTSVGTPKVGDGSTKVWLQTDATGSFAVSVGDTNAEDVLCLVTAENGQTIMKVLTFT